MTHPEDLALENAILRNLLSRTTAAYDEQVEALSREMDLAQTTLASIGDGVITTDDETRVRYMNPVAEKLTGWEGDRAVGRRVDEIFRLTDEASGIELEPVTARVLEGETHREPNGRLMLVREDGRRFAVEHTAAPIRNRAGRIVGVVIVFQDVTDQRLLSLQLAHQASHDALTGLLNREAFDDVLRRTLVSSRESGEEHCLLYLDLDQFKLVNDTCGHQAGDDLLRRVASVIDDEIREDDLLARLGGDEFGVLLRNCSLEPGLRRAERIHEVLAASRFIWQGRRFSIGSSIGVVPIDDRSKGLTQVLSAADHACYAAKEQGRGRIRVYQRDDAALARRADEMGWALRIRQTLDEERFQLFAQRICPASDSLAGSPLFFEILLRMSDEEGDLLVPASFIRAAERYGVMREIDRWVVSRVVDHLRRRPAGFLQSLGTCAINLSAVSVSDEGFLEFAHERLGAADVPTDKLCFEITETAAIANLDQARRLIRELSAMGCRFALDDFGSGMASYGKLKGLPVDYLKIDKAFVRELAHNPLDRAMVESINQMAHVLGIRTVAEGVSSKPLYDRVRALDVDYAQGFWIHRPGPLATLESEPGDGGSKE